MTLTKKMLAAFSVLFLVTACETAPTSNTSANGGGVNGMGGEHGVGSDESMGTLPGTNIPDRVFFDYDSSVVRPDGQDTLREQAGWLKEHAGTHVTIEGHCDERGTREYNLALGERRANAVKNYLVSQGVVSNRISVVSYGKERPAVVGDNEDAWAKNRRGVTVVQ
jgi:peptidoglycan-associated lipoprotein